MEWYEKWFNREYLDVYRHRDYAGALQQVRFVIHQTGIPVSARILDVACGAGRHLKAFAQEGCRSLAGVDLSVDLLSAARQELKNIIPASCLVRADMRVLPFQDCFDLATLFFTSFGYFFSDEENCAVLESVYNTLRPQGWIFLDYVNEPAVRAGLVPHTVREQGENRIEESRSINEKTHRLEKRIEIRSGHNVRSYTESVRLYNANEMVTMMRTAGFNNIMLYGDLSGQPLTQTSDRLMILALR